MAILIQKKISEMSQIILQALSKETQDSTEILLEQEKCTTKNN